MTTEVLRSVRYIICAQMCDRLCVRCVSRTVVYQHALSEASDVYSSLYRASFWFRAVGSGRSLDSMGSHSLCALF
jgi:hypothetical protein